MLLPLGEGIIPEFNKNVTFNSSGSRLTVAVPLTLLKTKLIFFVLNLPVAESTGKFTVYIYVPNVNLIVRPKEQNSLSFS